MRLAAKSLLPGTGRVAFKQLMDLLRKRFLPHCKYIGRRYYDILSCLIYHRNLVVMCTVDGGVQPMAAAVFDYSHS